MSTPTPPAEWAPEIEPLVLAVLEARVKDAKAAARVPLEKLYPAGRRETVRSPLDGRKLGTVYRTSPDPAWEITNRAALLEHLADDPANVEYVEELAVEGPALLDLLREILPPEALAGLVAHVERVRPAAVTAALRTAREGGEVAPGIGRVKPTGSLTVRPDPGAGAVVEALVSAGWITSTGERKALPAAEPVPAPTVPTEGPCTFLCGMYVHHDERGAVDTAGRFGHADCLAVVRADQARAAGAVSA